MATRPGPLSRPVDVPGRRRAAGRIAVLIAWAWLAAACGLGLCAFILLSLSAPWFGAVPLLLGVGALIRALSLRRKISAAKLGPARPMRGMPSVAANSPAVAAAKAGSPRTSSLSAGPDADTHADAAEFVVDIPVNARYTEHELKELGLDRWEPDAYRSSADQGGPAIGLWIGVGIVVLIGVVVARRRSARSKRAEVGADSAGDSSPVIPSSARDVPKIPHSPLVEGTDSVLSGMPSSTSAASTALLPDIAVPPKATGATPQPRRLGRFTPSPKPARFAVVPLLASFVLAFLAIRTAGDTTMSGAIPLVIASFAALGVAFYLAPAS